MRSGGPPQGRGLLLIPGGIALLAGLDAALLLLGLPAPVTTERLPLVHGPLLVLGFVGTVIALERAVALRHGAGYAAPVLLGAGGLLTLTPAPLALGQGVLAAGCAALLGLYAGLWRRQESGALTLQVLGAISALGGALLWWGGAGVPVSLPWFAGFLVLTIVGERLELARVGFLSGGVERGVEALGWTALAAVVATTLWPAPAHHVLGATLLLTVGLLVRHDVARRTLRAVGLPRFVARALLAGYAWLAVAGVIWLVTGPATQGPAYDAVVHAIFLGFTLGMIMAHAPVILPAVLRIPLPSSRAMDVPMVLLHASLALRVLVGDGYGQSWALVTGGALNVVAVLGFVGVAVWSAVRASRIPQPTSAPRSTTPRSTTPTAPRAPQEAHR